MNSVKEHEAGKQCPCCGKGTLKPLTVSETFEYEEDKRTITVEVEGVPVESCDTCGERFSGPEAARVRHDAVCRKLGLLTPSEIKDIRERLGMTQEEFAQITGIGVATISRWERGRLLQNKANDSLLRLLRDNPANINILAGQESEEAADHPLVVHGPSSSTPTEYKCIKLVDEEDSFYTPAGIFRWSCKCEPTDIQIAEQLAAGKGTVREFLGALTRFWAHYQRPMFFDALVKWMDRLPEKGGPPGRPVCFVFFAEYNSRWETRLSDELTGLAEMLGKIPENDRRAELVAAFKNLARMHAAPN